MNRLNGISDQRWALSAALLAATLLALGAGVAPTLEATFQVWMNSATYNHGFLVGPIALWLAWRERDRLAQLSPTPWLAPLAVIGIGSLLWLIGEIVTAIELQQFAVVFMVIACVLALLGKQVGWVIGFALAYLLFLVPTGEWMVPWLQDATAWFAIGAIDLIGIPVYGDGIIIEIPAGVFVVAEACAGLRFLVAMVAFGALLARLNFHSPKYYVLVLLLSVVVPIVANGLRVIGIILIGHWLGSAAAVDSDHVVFGWGFFTVVMMMLLLIVNRLREDPPPRSLSPAAHMPAPAVSVFPTAVAAVSLALMGPAIAASLALTAPARAPDWTPLVAPTGWVTAEPSDWKPSWTGADAYWRAGYRMGREPIVDLRVAYFTHQRRGVGVLGYNSRLADGSGTRIQDQTRRREAIGAAAAGVVESRVSQSSELWRTWHWYVVDERPTIDAATAKFWQLISIAPGRSRRAAIILLATPEDSDAEDRLRALALAFPGGSTAIIDGK